MGLVYENSCSRVIRHANHFAEFLCREGVSGAGSRGLKAGGEAGKPGSEFTAHFFCLTLLASGAL